MYNNISVPHGLLELCSYNQLHLYLKCIFDLYINVSYFKYYITYKSFHIILIIFTPVFILFKVLLCFTD